MADLRRTKRTTSFSNPLLLMEHFAWILFLVLIASSSLLADEYGSNSWLLFSFAYYAWLGFYLTLLLLGAPIGLKGLLNAKVVIILLVISMVWLFAQNHIVLEHGFYNSVFFTTQSNMPAPGWFNPRHLWSIVPQKTQWLLLGELLLFFVFVNLLMLVRSRRRLLHLLALLVLLGLIHSIVGLVSKIAGVVLVDIAELDGHYSAVRGIYVNRNHFGAYLVLCSSGAIALQMYFNLKNAGSSLFNSAMNQLVSPRVFVLLGLSTSLMAILASESRGASLSLVAAMFLTLLCNGKLFQASNYKLFVFLAVCLVFFASHFGQVLVSRFFSEGVALGERTLQWKWTWAAIRENPLFGYGGGSYATVFQAYRPVGEFRQVIFTQSHNYYLHIWLERGLIGLGLWMAIFYLTLSKAIMFCRSHPSRLVTASLVGCSISIIAALVQSLVDYNLLAHNIRMLFMVVLATAFVAPMVRHKTVKN